MWIDRGWQMSRSVDDLKALLAVYQVMES
jgi:hypothetical protein